jgi:hypothetical protein
MEWDLTGIEFLYSPDVFLGSFDNEKMQARQEELKAEKIEAIKKAVRDTRDPLEAMSKLNKRDHIQFLLNNIQSFRDSDTFEVAVLKLYRGKNSPFYAEGDFMVWSSLFDSCNAEKLYKLGDPVTFQAGTVYRISVTGTEKSLSWTLSREKIKKFEDRWHEQKAGNGIIHAVDIQRENILVYLTDRDEDEVILDPNFLQTAKIRKLPSIVLKK